MIDPRGLTVQAEKLPGGGGGAPALPSAARAVVREVKSTKPRVSGLRSYAQRKWFGMLHARLALAAFASRAGSVCTWQGLYTCPALPCPAPIA